MSLAAHRTEQTEQRVTRVPVQRTASADPVVAPPRRVRVSGYTGPPTRRRVVGAPRVITRQECAPRRRVSFLSLFAVGAAVCLAVVGLGMLAGASGAAESVPTRTEVVFVKPGETLSEVAVRMAPSSDTEAVVARIRELNGVDGVVEPGRPLRVPSEG